jgi:hypothetical protein
MIRIADIAGRLVHDQTLQNRILGLVELCLVLLIAVTLARLVLDLIPPAAETGIESVTDVWNGRYRRRDRGPRADIAADTA